MSRQRDLNFSPGPEYLYGNAAYIRAAVIVERACGQSFGAFSREPIFRSRRRERDCSRRRDVGEKTFPARLPERPVSCALLGNAGDFTRRQPRTR